MTIGASTVALRAVSRKSHTVSNPIQDEMRLQAVSRSLWLALFAAQEAGLSDVVDGVSQLYQQVNRRLREVA